MALSRDRGSGTATSGFIIAGGARWAADVKGKPGHWADAFSGLPREVWLLSGAMLVNRAGTMVLPFGPPYGIAVLAIVVLTVGEMLAMPISNTLGAKPFGSAIGALGLVLGPGVAALSRSFSGRR